MANDREMASQDRASQEIRLIKSAIESYDRALEVGVRTDNGEPLSAADRSFYAREIVKLQGRSAAILGAMAW